LAIIRRLAALLEHHLRIDSEPGKGSRFSVEVPRAMRVVSTGVPARATSRSRPSTLANARVAVIDDENIVVEGMQALFGAWGAQVVGAASAEAMLAALGEAEAYPDLLIADYRLARDELGTSAIARLRHELGLTIPALLISGDSSAPALDALRASGVDFLLKPVLPEELKAEAERLLASGAAGRWAPERDAVRT
jgi:CheY-like chemotaxis protein